VSGLILAGDIGGTKITLALFNRDLALVVEKTFHSREHAGLGEILHHFVAENRQPVERACFGVPGPVIGGQCSTTNLPWVVDARDLAADLGIRSVGLINDLEASAWGLAALKPEDLVVLSEGAPHQRGNAALIAAGTGLGEAGLFWDGARHRPFACEGGHATFGPRNALEADLARYLIERFDHVSWERVVSGPGLENVYLFLRDSGRGEEPPWLAERIREGDPAAAISQAALEESSDLCVRTLDLFISLYGAEAGNLALKIMATGGVFVGGGIAPRILQKMRGGAFMEAFRAKGRMRPLLESMPVRVVLNERAALLGAARWATLAG
jgi:glucokinase